MIVTSSSLMALSHRTNYGKICTKSATGFIFISTALINTLCTTLTTISLGCMPVKNKSLQIYGVESVSHIHINSTRTTNCSVFVQCALFVMPFESSYRVEYFAIVLRLHGSCTRNLLNHRTVQLRNYYFIWPNNLNCLTVGKYICLACGKMHSTFSHSHHRTHGSNTNHPGWLYCLIAERRM